LNLLAGLVDDAGLFPPESLPMAAALARHRTDEEAGYSMLSNRFLCPASRLGELRAELAREAEIPNGGNGGIKGGKSPPWGEARAASRGPVRLGLILDTGVDGLPAARAGVAGEPRLALELIEVPAPSAEAVAAALDALAGIDVPVYLEGPREPGWGWLKTVGAWSGPGGLRGAKVRCGGARADLFPSPEELAAFAGACFAQGVPFKATAGLHGAVRHTDGATGFVHHGFLNVVLAAVRAAAGAPVDEIAAVLASTEGGALAAAALGASAREVVAARSLFHAYGSCSTREPREEAARLGLVV
jgi:hypothetical protein